MKKIRINIFVILLISVLTLTGCGENFNNYTGITNVTNNYEIESIFMEVGQVIEFDFYQQFKYSGLDITRIDAKSSNESVATIDKNKITAVAMGRTIIDVVLYNKSTLSRHLATALKIYVIDSDNMTEIKTAQDLANIHLDNKGNYILKSDIDLSDFGVWTPIPNFEGMLVNFDGYKIKNLTIFSELLLDYSNWSLGLFGSVYNAYIDGLVLENVYIDTSNTNNVSITTGAIAGYIDFSTIIINCKIDGTIIAKETAGGFIGRIGRGTIKGCSFNGFVKTTSSGNVSYAGGIAGEVYETTIDDCLVEATIVANFAAGGIIGKIRNINNASVNNSEFIGELLNAKNKGSIFGYSGF